MTPAPKDPSEEIDEAASKHFDQCKNYQDKTVKEWAMADFKAGAAFERKRILGILRGDKFDKYLRDNAINELDPFYFSDWLEKELK